MQVFIQSICLDERTACISLYSSDVYAFSKGAGVHSERWSGRPMLEWIVISSDPIGRTFCLWGLYLRGHVFQEIICLSKSVALVTNMQLELDVCWSRSATPYKE